MSRPISRPISRLSILARHPAIWLMALSVLLGLAWMVLAAPAWAWALVPLGIGAQMLNEYSLHRYVFHLAPPRRQWAFNLLYRAHYGHHDAPDAPDLFFVPIWVAAPVLVGNFLLLWALAGLVTAVPLAVAVAVVAVGGAATFLGYEWFHMTAHLPVRRSAVERYVARLHARHHFRDPGSWFHVSPGGAVIDRAMGTAASEAELRSRPRMADITTLGLAPDDPRLVAARARYAHLLEGARRPVAASPAE